MFNKGIVNTTVAAVAILSSSAFASEDLLRLDNSTMDSITGGTYVVVSVSAAGSGTSSGQTQVAGYAVSSETYPATIIVAGGGAIACCGEVETNATAATSVTHPGRFSLDTSIHQTVSGLGLSVSFGTGFVIDSF